MAYFVYTTDFPILLSVAQKHGIYISLLEKITGKFYHSTIKNIIEKEFPYKVKSSSILINSKIVIENFGKPFLIYGIIDVEGQWASAGFPTKEILFRNEDAAIHAKMLWS